MNTINHIAFNCRDLAAQEAFYTRHFGFKRSRTFNPGQPNEFFMLKLGSIRLEMFGADKAKLTPEDKGGEQPIGFKHLAFEIPKLEPVIEGLKADGIEVGNIIDASKHVSGLRICFFKDPEGHILELMEGYHDEV